MLSAKQKEAAARATVDTLNSTLRSAYLNANKYWNKIEEVAIQVTPDNTYEESIKALNIQFEYENNFDSLNDLFTRLDNVRNNLETVGNILSLKDLSRGAVYNRSQTYANELFVIETAYKHAADKFREIPIDPVILAFDEVISIDRLEKMPLNQFTITLIKRFTRKESLPGTVREIVEARKDVLLGATRVQGCLARNGLVPGHFGTPSGNYVTIAGDTSYDLRPLIDPDFIAKHDLVLKMGAGINKKTVEKYATTLHAKPAKIAPATVNVENDSDEFRVWMKIGNAYRAMVRSGKDTFSRREIESLFSVTTRPARYYETIYEDPTDPMFQFYADKYAVAKLDISDDIIRKRLFDEFTDRWQAMKLTNFHEIATDRDIISGVIVKVLHATIVKSDNPDMMCGYIIRYEALIREFVNAIDKEIKNMHISQDIAGHLRDLYRKVIESISWTGFEPSLKELLAGYSHN